MKYAITPVMVTHPVIARRWIIQAIIMVVIDQHRVGIVAIEAANPVTRDIVGPIVIAVAIIGVSETRTMVDAVVFRANPFDMAMTIMRTVSIAVIA